MEFRKLELADKKAFDEMIDRAADVTGWEYSFEVIWIWNVAESVYIYIGDGMILMYGKYADKTVFYPPYCAPEDTGRALEAIAAYCGEKAIPCFIRGVSNDMLGYVDKDAFTVTSEPDNFDYIYAAEDLISLRGKKFHSKRNYVTRFSAKYAYTFRPYVSDDRDALMDLYDKWNTATEHETLSMERKAIDRAFVYCGELGLLIYVLEADGRPIAFSVSVSGKRGVVHNIFEKGDIEYEGVYQMINKLTAEACFGDFRLVNRQEDMGIEGLRKAKMSYNPVFLQPKYVLLKK